MVLKVGNGPNLEAMLVGILYQGQDHPVTLSLSLGEAAQETQS